MHIVTNYAFYSLVANNEILYYWLYFNYFIRWCPSCSEWKKELLTFVRNPLGVDWTSSESWRWPDSSEHIVPVFLSSKKGGSKEFTLTDLSVACKIWSNCKQITVKDIYVKNVLKVRNSTFHNLQVTPAEKARVFDALRDIFRDSDVNSVNSVETNKCLKGLTEIEKGSKHYMEKLEYRLNELQLGQESLTYIVNTISHSVDDISNNRDSGTWYNRIHLGIKQIPYLAKCGVVMLCFLLFVQGFFNFNEFHTKSTEDSSIHSLTIDKGKIQFMFTELISSSVYKCTCKCGVVKILLEMYAPFSIPFVRVYLVLNIFQRFNKFY